MTDTGASPERTVLTMEPYPAPVKAVGAWLGAMQTMRQGLLHALARIDRAGWGNGFLDWRTLRSPPGEDYSATPEWIVFHLVEHEAGHLYGIHRLVRLWREQRGLHAE